MNTTVANILFCNSNFSRPTGQRPCYSVSNISDIHESVRNNLMKFFENDEGIDSRVTKNNMTHFMASHRKLLLVTILFV